MKTDEIKKEDKVAMKPFLIIMVISCMLGGLVGYGMITLANDSVDLVQRFHNYQLGITGFAGYATLAVSILLCIGGFSVLNYCQKYYQKNNLEDENALNKLEKWLSIDLFITSISTILSWLLYGIGFYGITFNDNLDLPAMIFCLLGFIIMTISTTILQQKVVNFEKELNPEKRGSVYDVKFHKKWMESCDEAERYFIYKCAYHAYKATNITCTLLAVILFFVGAVLPIGILPMVCVCIIWGVLTFTYLIASLKIGEPTDKQQ